MEVCMGLDSKVAGLIGQNMSFYKRTCMVFHSTIVSISLAMTVLIYC